MRSRGLMLALPGLVGGCSALGAGEPTQEKWTVQVSLSRPSISIPHAASDNLTITVARGGGFTGPVIFSAAPPPGLTAVFSDIVTTGTVTTALITVGAGANSNLTYTTVIPLHVATPSDLVADLGLEVSVTPKVGFWVTAPATLSVPRGSASGPIRVTFTKTGFTDDVTMSLALFNGAPAGITATFTPNPIVVDTVTSMTVMVDPSVSEGTYTVGTRANGGGYQGTSPLSLTVTAAPTLGLTLNSSTLNVVRGTNLATLLTFQRTNFTAPITMTVTSPPPFGMVISFSPNPSPGATTLVNVNATPAMALGTYIISLTSSGFGVPVVTIPLTVTVLP